MQLAHIYREGLAFKVGDGRRVLFWKDVRCGDRSLKQDFQDLYDLTANKKSRVVGNYSICGRETVWNPEVRRHFHDWEIPRVIELRAHLHNTKVDHGSEDKRIWKAALSGDFLVKSSYEHFDQHGQSMGHWKEVWNCGVPPKIQFMWMAVLEKLSTMDALWSKGFALPSICLLCYKDSINQPSSYPLSIYMGDLVWNLA